LSTACGLRLFLVRDFLLLRSLAIAISCCCDLLLLQSLAIAISCYCDLLLLRSLAIAISCYCDACYCLCMHKTGWTCQDAMRPLRNLATTGRFQQARPSLRALWDDEQSQAFLQTVYVYIRQVGPFRTRRDLCRISRPLAVSNKAHTTKIHTTKLSRSLAVFRYFLLSLAVSCYL